MKKNRKLIFVISLVVVCIIIFIVGANIRDLPLSSLIMWTVFAVLYGVLAIYIVRTSIKRLKKIYQDETKQKRAKETLSYSLRIIFFLFILGIFVRMQVVSVLDMKAGPVEITLTDANFKKIRGSRSKSYYLCGEHNGKTMKIRISKYVQEEMEEYLRTRDTVTISYYKI